MFLGWHLTYISVRPLSCLRGFVRFSLGGELFMPYFLVGLVRWQVACLLLLVRKGIFRGKLAQLRGFFSASDGIYCGCMYFVTRTCSFLQYESWLFLYGTALVNVSYPILSQERHRWLCSIIRRCVNNCQQKENLS